jgi:hypothetical protein
MKKALLIILFFLNVYFFSYALTEEEIYDEREKRLSLYSLSNNASEIERAILARTEINITLANVSWELDPNISESIKDVMNRLNLNYAMTSHSYLGFLGAIMVYRRVGSQWFIYVYPIFSSNLLDLLSS